MRVIDWSSFIGTYSPNTETAMTVGVFDGVHLGHQELLKRVSSLKSRYTPTVISFSRNPKDVLSPGSYEGDILSLDQKLGYFERLGIVQTVLIDFSGIFSKLSGKEFLDFLKNRGNLRYLVIGSSFRCGYGLDMDAPAIKEANKAEGIPTDVVPPFMAGSRPVSSSRIRTEVRAGSLAEAAALLGRNVEIDLTGIPAAPGTGGTSFDVAAVRRIMPPPGRYPVILHEKTPPPGGISAETSVIIDERGIFIPSQFNAGSVEFLT
ncbi:FAD synthetase family protein [Treponema sp. OttesenSCG-928-L16]|nr:FAD synthetase family protein [Treponema sp. OttesenSCG-928-L16]